MKYLTVLILFLSTTCYSGSEIIPHYFQRAAKLAHVDTELLYAICMTESAGKVNARRISDGNSPSYGICQIKLNTAKLVGFKGDVKKLMQPEVNTLYAGKYLHRLIWRYFDIKKAISAYNAGKYTKKNKLYVRKVLSKYYRYTGASNGKD